MPSKPLSFYLRKRLSMTISLRKLMLLVMLISMLKPQLSSAEVNLVPKTSTQRQYDEAFVTCVEQNIKCHQSLREASVPQSNLSLFLAGLGIALVSGMLLEHQLVR